MPTPRNAAVPAPDAAGPAQAGHRVGHGAGHAGPGRSACGSGPDPQGPNTIAEMLHLFRLHALRP